MMTTKTSNAILGLFFFMSLAGCSLMAALTDFSLGWMLAGATTGCLTAFATLTALD